MFIGKLPRSADAFLVRHVHLLFANRNLKLDVSRKVIASDSLVKRAGTYFPLCGREKAGKMQNRNTLAFRTYIQRRTISRLPKRTELTLLSPQADSRESS